MPVLMPAQRAPKRGLRRRKRPAARRSLWERLWGWLGLTPPARRAAAIRPLSSAAEKRALRYSATARAAEAQVDELVGRGLDEKLARIWVELSPREQQVTALICQGCTNRQIAARLGLSPETIKSYAANTRRKFDAPSKADLRLMLAEWDFTEMGGKADG